MRRIVTVCAAGLTALVMAGAATAMAQPLIYGNGYYGGDDGYRPPPPPPPYYEPGLYGYARPYNPQRGYHPRRETYVGPYGHVYRRCRPHHSCYDRPDY